MLNIHYIFFESLILKDGFIRVNLLTEKNMVCTIFKSIPELPAALFQLASLSYVSFFLSPFAQFSLYLTSIISNIRYQFFLFFHPDYF